MVYLVKFLKLSNLNTNLKFKIELLSKYIELKEFSLNNLEQFD